MINTLFFKILTFLLLSFFVVSCNNIELESIENDLNDFMDWALSDTVIESAQSYSTISSSTLNSFVRMDENYEKYEFLLNNKNNIIGFFLFNNDLYDIGNYRDELILISRAQKSEGFNINIISNVNKNKTRFLLDKIEEMLILNGVNKDKIVKIYNEKDNKIIIIKILKVNLFGMLMKLKNSFERIDRLPPYVFAEVNSMKANERSFGEDIIDFGMGNPDSSDS